MRLGRNYAALWTAGAAANLGDGIGVVAWPWLASLLTRDPFAIALVAAALRLPWLVMPLPAGVLTDRLDRRRLVLSMDLFRATALLGLGLAVHGAGVPAAAAEGFPDGALYWFLVAGAVAVGSAEVLRDNAAQTLMPALVPPERLETANGRLWSVEIAANTLVGPPLGGAILAVSVPLAFLLNGAGFAASALLMLTIRGRFVAERPEPRHWWPELREGVAFLWRNPLLRTLAFALGALNALEQMFFVALVLYAQELLGMSSGGYGLLLTAGAFGGILGGFLAGNVVRLCGPGTAVRLAILATTLQLGATAVAAGAAPVWAALFLGSFMGMVWNSVTVTLRQRLIPARLLGRVNSVYRLFGWGTMPLGMLLAGGIVALAEPVLGREMALRAPFAAGALLGAVFAALVWRRLSDRALREARFA